jgi:predicted N-acetyltransferase YhbS
LIDYVPLAEIPREVVEQLLDAAFGADRRQRTAYRLREGVEAIRALSLAAVHDGELIGSLQCWPVELATENGASPLVLVGPVAVRPDRQRDGIGRALMTRMLETADRQGEIALMLIGDAEYYERFFGFAAAPTQGWRLPGPVDRHRLLARIAPGHHLPVHGAVRPRANR